MFDLFRNISKYCQEGIKMRKNQMFFSLLGFNFDRQVLEELNKYMFREYSVKILGSINKKGNSEWMLKFYDPFGSEYETVFLGRLSYKSLSLLSNPRLNGTSYILLTHVKNFLSKLMYVIRDTKQEKMEELYLKKEESTICSNQILNESLDNLKVYSENVLEHNLKEYDIFLKTYHSLKIATKILEYNLETLRLHEREKDKDTMNRMLVLISKFKSFGDEYFQ